jgi:prepilin peptidase CpaA
MNDFTTSALAVAGGVCFTLALAIASVWDIRSRRIPNWLVIAVALLGVCYSALMQSPLSGISRALLGMVIGFGLWIPFYALGMLGAGDVKLFAAASCWFAPSQVVGAALVSALAGGVLSVIGLVLAHGLGLATLRVAHGIRDPKILATPLAVPKGRKTLPYGLAMTVGLLIVAWFPRWLHLS